MTTVTQHYPFKRPLAGKIRSIIEGGDDRVLMIHGPRRSGKTVMAQQLIAELGCLRKMITGEDRITSEPYHTLDLRSDPIYEISSCPDQQALSKLCSQIRQELRAHPKHTKYVLIIDEVHEIKDFAMCVKSLWDENRKLGCEIRFVLMGSSPQLIQQAYEESKLSKCATVISWPHWSFKEVKQAFGCDLETYLFYGGYPEIYEGGLVDKEQIDTWRSRIHQSIIDPSLERDIMKMGTQIDKDLLKGLFRIVTEGSSTVRSIKKIADQIGEGENQATIKKYLGYLQQAWFIMRIPIFTKQKQLKEERSKADCPKLIVLNTALMTAQHARGLREEYQKQDAWGRVMETAAGAYLYGLGYGNKGCGKNLYYWRDDKKKGCEIDYVIEDRDQDKIAAFEVKKSFVDMTRSKRENMNHSIVKFEEQFGVNPLKVGKGGDISLAEFLSTDPEQWLEKRTRLS